MESSTPRSCASVVPWGMLGCWLLSSELDVWDVVTVAMVPDVPWGLISDESPLWVVLNVVVVALMLLWYAAVVLASPLSGDVVVASPLSAGVVTSRLSAGAVTSRLSAGAVLV